MAEKKKGKVGKVGRPLPTHFADLITLGHLVSPTVMQQNPPDPRNSALNASEAEVHLNTTFRTQAAPSTCG